MAVRCTVLMQALRSGPPLSALRVLYSEPCALRWSPGLTCTISPDSESVKEVIRQNRRSAISVDESHTFQRLHSFGARASRPSAVLTTFVDRGWAPKH